jgi:hypothetical protein
MLLRGMSYCYHAFLQFLILPFPDVLATSSKTVVTMAFKLCQCAQKRWQRLYGYRKLGKVIRGIKIDDGVEEMRNAA